MTSPVIEAKAKASYKRRKEIAWECGCIIPEWDCLGRGVQFTEADCLKTALKALEENITDEMILHGVMALSNNGVDEANTDDAKECFTAMLRAARGE